MALKIVLLIALAVALPYGYAQDCISSTSRAQRMFWSKQRSLIVCDSPKDTLVQLKVPEGFDYVKPSVVRIPQCSGLFCSNHRTKCLPVNIQMKSLTVEAFKAGEGHNPSCVEVYVEEHTACSCACVQTECKPKQILNDTTCECECDPRRRSYCEAASPSGELIVAQWSEESCDCQCNVVGM